MALGALGDRDHIRGGTRWADLLGQTAYETHHSAAGRIHRDASSGRGGPRYNDDPTAALKLPNPRVERFIQCRDLV